MCPYASSNDCCIVHSTSARADPELVGGSGGGWSCMLLLHPASTCADAGPDLCTLHSDLCTLCLRWLSLAATCGGGVSLSAIGTNTPLAHVVVSPIATCAGGVYPSTHWRTYWWFHPLLLALVVFILPPTDADTGGFTHCYLRWWCLSFHPLMQILVVSPIATCAGGVYPSTH